MNRMNLNRRNHRNHRNRRNQEKYRDPRTRISPALFALVLLAGSVLQPSFRQALAKDSVDTGADYNSIPFTLPASNRLVPADLNGDGHTDLLAANESTLSLYLQKTSGPAFVFSSPDAQLTLPGAATGWALDNLVGTTSGAKRIVALINGKQLLAWTLDPEGFGKSATVLESSAGLLPAGHYHLNFVRDVNGDQLNDLLVPGAAELEIYLQQKDGSYAAPVQVKSRMLNWSRVNREENLGGRVGQSVRIPSLTIRDLNGDGRMDVVSSSEERLDVFLAESKGHFPADASYSVDLKALRERVGEVDLDKVDYSNLSGLLAHTFEIELEDVDGDKVEDLLIREGGKITLFGGTKTGMDMEKPRQVLKSSGNVLAITLRDEDDDGRKDLWLMRVEDISLGNLFLWLAVSGSVDIETFVYRNEGERFASRPHRKVTLDVKFPSILNSVDLVNAAMDPKTASAPANARATVDDTGQGNDVAVLEPRSIAMYRNVLPDSQVERFLGQADFSRERDNYVYDLGKALENPSGQQTLTVVRGKEASFTLPIGDGEFSLDPNQAGLVAWDINGDGRDDFFVLSQRSESEISGYLLMSK